MNNLYLIEEHRFARAVERTKAAKQELDGAINICPAASAEHHALRVARAALVVAESFLLKHVP